MPTRVPRRLSILFVLACTLVACGDTPTPGPSAFAGDATRFFEISEVGLGPNGYVTLLNYTDQAATLDGLRLCQPPTCADLPDTVVAGGGVARVAVGDATGIESVVLERAGLQLRPAEGEVALFADGGLDDPDAIRSYLEWGSTPHAATPVAVRAGLWREGSYAPSGTDATRLYRTDANLWVFDTAAEPRDS